jgi:MinD-like ATPase involved in chromosome partitioning or flagellar assembly
LKSHKIISFVSGKGGAGKSVILANLAALITRNEESVLMVDCDFFTRGLTFYMIGDKPARTGILDYLKGDEPFDHLAHRLEERIKDYDHLSLLPASSRTTLYSVSDLDGKVHARDSDSLKKIYSDLRELLVHLAKRFDYVLVDTRSGVDPVSLLPALASDEYILVVEEDKTSWRIGDLLIAEMRKISDCLAHSKLGSSSTFKGFIINKVTEEIPEEFVQGYLEKRVIEGKCLLQIPLEKAVPMAFKVDKLVIDESPSSTFSQKTEMLSYIVRGIPFLEKPKKGLAGRIDEFFGANETLIMIIAVLTYFGGVLLMTAERQPLIYLPMLLFSLGLLFTGFFSLIHRLLKRKRS